MIGSVRSAPRHHARPILRALAFAMLGAAPWLGCGGASDGSPASTPSSAPSVASPSAATTSALRDLYAPLETSPAADQLVSANDRTDADRAADERRHPAELLTFLAIEPGMSIADLGAGSGYTTELIARAVGDGGTVFAQNNAHVLEKFVSESWPARLERPVNNRVIRVDREYGDPLPPEAKDLDLVTILFAYHDVVAEGTDVAQLNATVFASLKSGGRYVIADHAANEDAPLDVASSLHRIPEAIVREQVEAAGFVFVEDAQFLRDDNDPRDTVSYEVEFETDRFLLMFRKP